MASMRASTTSGEVMAPGMKMSQPKLTLRETSAPAGIVWVQFAASSARRTAWRTSRPEYSTATTALGVCWALESGCAGDSMGESRATREASRMTPVQAYSETVPSENPSSLSTRDLPALLWYRCPFFGSIGDDLHDSHCTARNHSSVPVRSAPARRGSQARLRGFAARAL